MRLRITAVISYEVEYDESILNAAFGTTDPQGVVEAERRFLNEGDYFVSEYASQDDVTEAFTVEVIG